MTERLKLTDIQKLYPLNDKFSMKYIILYFECRETEIIPRVLTTDKYK